MKEGICHHDNIVNYIRMDQQTYMDRSQCLYSLQLNGVIYLSVAALVGPFHVTASQLTVAPLNLNFVDIARYGYVTLLLLPQIY